jgi:hypothetical protein
MLFAAACLLFISFVALAFVGVTEARVGVRRLEKEIDRRSIEMTHHFGQDDDAAAREAEALAEARFSSSLLSLSKAHLQARHDFPERALDESSSSVLVPLTQSKNPVPQS